MSRLNTQKPSQLSRHRDYLFKKKMLKVSLQRTKTGFTGILKWPCIFVKTKSRI